MSDTPTFTFENGEVFAISGGKVIASGPDMSEVEKDASSYTQALDEKSQAQALEDKKRRATHIITPNGVKGRILGSSPDIWGEDNITVRFENNHVSSFSTHGEEGFEWVTENIRTAGTSSPADKLEERLSSDYGVDRDSLIARQEELKGISKDAHSLIRSEDSYEISQRVDNLHTAAEYEIREIGQVLEQMDDKTGQEHVGIAPFQSKAHIQSDMGRAKGDSWLDVTANEMIKEAEGQNLDKLLNEGPGSFVADLDDGAIVSTGTVRDMATGYVTSKTAGFEGEDIEQYRDAFVARTEVARRHELASRKSEVKKQVTAARDEASNFPDEALFS